MKLERLSNTAAVAALPVALFVATRKLNVAAEYTGSRRFKGKVFKRGKFVDLVYKRGRFRAQLLRAGETFEGQLGNRAITILDAEQGFEHEGRAVVQFGSEIIGKKHEKGRKKGKVFFRMRGKEKPIYLEHRETKDVGEGLKLTYIDPRRR